jgi:hypothetical protein
VSTLRKTLTNIGSSAVGVLTVVVSLLTLYPRMTVTVSFDTNEPLSSSFLVSNDGYLPAFSVSPICMVSNVYASTSPSPEQAIEEENRPLPIKLRLASVPTVTLYPGAKEAIPFSDCIATGEKGILKLAHVGLRVVYRPLFWPWNRSIAQEFYARRTENSSQFFWYTVPYSK